MNITDLLIGALLVNAMPHLIFGITKTKFLGLFGFSAMGNIMYALLQLCICLVLFHLKYGIANILENGIFVGGLAVLLSFFCTGKFLLRSFEKWNGPK